MWISSCPCTICWKNYSFFSELPWTFYWRSTGHKFGGLFLDSQFYFIDLYIYPYAILLFLDFIKTHLPSGHLKSLTLWAGSFLMFLFICCMIFYIICISAKMSLEYLKYHFLAILPKIVPYSWSTILYYLSCFIFFTVHLTIWNYFLFTCLLCLLIRM